MSFFTPPERVEAMENLVKRPRWMVYADPMSHPPYKTARYYPPWKAPQVYRHTQGPQIPPLFIEACSADYRTTRAHTHDIVCSRTFFDRDMESYFNAGDFLLMYIGPERVDGEKITHLPSTESRSQMKKVVPLKFLQKIIREKCQVEKKSKKWKTRDVCGEEYNDYVRFANKEWSTASIELILSLISSPQVFASCFVPVGFMKSFNGVEVYHGSHVPLVTCQYSGKMEVSVANGDASPQSCHSGTKLYYIVGMKSNGGNPAYNYVYPTLAYSMEDYLPALCGGYIQKSKRDFNVPCYVKEIGTFMRNYDPAIVLSTTKIDLNMQRDYDKIYV